MQAKKSLQNVMEFMFARETCCKLQQNASKERFAKDDGIYICKRNLLQSATECKQRKVCKRLQNLCFQEKTCCKVCQNESEENFARDYMPAKKNFVARHNRIYKNAKEINVLACCNGLRNVRMQEETLQNVQLEKS